LAHFFGVMMKTYAIGDIHGHFGLLQGIHGLIADDMAATGPAPIVHIGDLVDRGPNSAEVVEYLRAGIAGGANWTVLKGNHDRMFSGYLTALDYHDTGLRSGLSYLHPRIGGGETLASYGVKNASDRPLAPVWDEAVAAVPMAHRDFLQNLPSQYLRGDVLFAHAGIRPGVALDVQTEDDLIWIRHDFLDDTRDHGPLIVHGHTAIDAPTHYRNRVNIDSSAAYGGPLSAIVVEVREVWQITPQGRVRLTPAT
jgi:serine/threonine protein phosphatase 1